MIVTSTPRNRAASSDRMICWHVRFGVRILMEDLAVAIRLLRYAIRGVCGGAGTERKGRKRGER